MYLFSTLINGVLKKSVDELSIRPNRAELNPISILSKPQIKVEQPVVNVHVFKLESYFQQSLDGQGLNAVMGPVAKKVAKIISNFQAMARFLISIYS